MAIDVFAPLTFAWEFLKPILSDSVKERLKPATSQATAKRRAFGLFQQLEWVGFVTGQFVDSLDRFTGVMSSRPTLSEQEDAKRELTAQVQDLSTALTGLAEILQDLDPQLPIHQPAVVQQIRQYSMCRNNTFLEIRTYLGLDEYAQRDAADLRATAVRARMNQRMIVAATEDFRKFLAQEFPFKESF